MTLLQRLAKLKDEGYRIILIHDDKEILTEGFDTILKRTTFMADNGNGHRDIPVVVVTPGKARALFEWPDEFSEEFKTKVAGLFTIAARATQKQRHYWHVIQTEEVTFTDLEWNQLNVRTKDAYTAWNHADNQMLRELQEIKCTSAQIPLDVHTELQELEARFMAKRPVGRRFQLLAPAPPPVKFPPKRKPKTVKAETSKAQVSAVSK